MSNTLYIGECKQWGTSVKVGTTINLAGNILDHNKFLMTPFRYKAVFTLITPLTIPLEDLDQFEFPDWMKEKKRGGEHINKGGGTEFWNLVNPIETIQQFLTEKGIGYELIETSSKA